MKKFKSIITLSIIIFSLFCYGCNQEGSPSLYEDEPAGTAPVISGIVPADAALAGVTEVSISGSNFSNVPEHNFVFFGTAKATVISASTNLLVVKAPVLIQENVELKIAVQGSENFSNKISYNLLEASGEYYGFMDFETPYALTIDNNNNIFFSLVSSNIGQGVMKLAPDGTVTNFAPKGGETFYNDLKMGKNNIIYGARNARAIFAIEEGKNPAVFVTFPTGTVITELDIDQNDNIWAAGKGNNIFSADINKNVKSFPVNYTVNALRVFNGYLYAAGTNDTEEAVWRYNIISANELGAEEKYFDIAGTFGLAAVAVNAITFSNDGDLYLGTDQEDPIIVVHADKSYENLYPGVVFPSVYAFTWGNNNNLFYTREAKGDFTQTIIRVDMQKSGAPYYGK